MAAGACLLSLVNAALFVLLIFQHISARILLRRVTRKYETLISMPERFVSMTWLLIYALVFVFVICDLVAPSLSTLALAPHPNLLRILFSAATITNMVRILMLEDGDVYLSTVMVSIQWLALSTLYLFLMLIAPAQQGHQPGLARYLLGEAGVIMYTAWTCVEMVHSYAMLLQVYFQACLAFRSYFVLLVTLSFISNWAVIFYKDLIFGVVATWALMLIAAKSSAWQTSSLERLQDRVGEASLQLAVMGGTITTIALAALASQ
jgi:hypothetical protein